MSNNKFHYDSKKKKNTKRLSKQNPAHSLKLVAFENSMAANPTDADIKRASFLFNNLQGKVIKTKITRIHLN